MIAKLHVTKAIWSDEACSDLLDNLYRDIELPFLPFIGLVVKQEGWYWDSIERLSWSVDNQSFAPLGSQNICEMGGKLEIAQQMARSAE